MNEERIAALTEAAGLCLLVHTDAFSMQGKYIELNGGKLSQYEAGRMSAAHMCFDHISNLIEEESHK